MWRQTLLFLQFCLIVSQKSVHGQAETNFRLFMGRTSQGFGPWMANKGWDPTPSFPGSFSIPHSNAIYEIVDGNIWNLSIWGTSRNAGAYIQDHTSLISGLIDMHYRIPNAGILGSYNASGSIMESYPINANGDFRTQSGEFAVDYSIRIYAQNGYLQINQTSATDGYRYYGVNATFDNLFNEQTIVYQDLVIPELAEQVRARMASADIFHPYMTEYLQEVFDRTSIEDMITAPPTTTITTPLPITVTTAWPNSTSNLSETVTMIMPTTPQPGCNRADPKSARLNNFLYNLLGRNFSDWLSQNNFDPTTPFPGRSELLINSSFLSLQGEFWSTQATGMIQSQRYVYCASSNLLDSSIRLPITFHNPVMLFGLYEANGSVISTYPLSGQGIWSIRYNTSEMRIDINGFTIQDGYINLKQHDSISVEQGRSTNGTISISDLITANDADGMGFDVLRLLEISIPEALIKHEGHPLVYYLLEYLDQHFKATPLRDIIGA